MTNPEDFGLIARDYFSGWKEHPAIISRDCLPRGAMKACLLRHDPSV
jgi:hypothetical protein